MDLEEEAALNNVPGYVPTYISLPPERRPASWKKFKDPVVKLRRNLYGHKLAGLFWETYVTRKLLEQGFEKVPCWESLFVHRRKKVFLSIYVDDIKLAG